MDLDRILKWIIVILLIIFLIILRIGPIDNCELCKVEVNGTEKVLLDLWQQEDTWQVFQEKCLSVNKGLPNLENLTIVNPFKI